MRSTRSSNARRPSPPDNTKSQPSDRHGNEQASEKTRDASDPKTIGEKAKKQEKKKASTAPEKRQVAHAERESTESLPATTAAAAPIAPSTTRERDNRSGRYVSAKKKTSQNHKVSKEYAWEEPVHDFLRDYVGGRLDEDEMLVKMNRIFVRATQQFESIKGMMSTSLDDDALFEECFSEAQELSIVDDLLRDLMKAHPSLDRRAVSWIKRTMGASGQRKKSSRYIQFAQMRQRRTRGSTRSTAAGNFGGKGDNIMFEAVKALEIERGEKFRPEKRRAGAAFLADDDDDDGQKRKVRRRSKRREDEDSQSTDKRHGREEEGESMRLKGETRKETKADLCIDLNRYEAGRRKLFKSLNKNYDSRTGGFETYQKRLATQLPQSYTQLGIIHRLPDWETIQAEDLSEDKKKNPLPRLSEKVPSQRSRRFLLSDRFYCDLDLEWYSDPEAGLAELGSIGPDKGRIWIASEDWKCKRRQYRRRRFSKHFLQNEKNALEEYRCAVRFLQSNINVADEIAFPYSVPKPPIIGENVAVLKYMTGTLDCGTVAGWNENSRTYTVDIDEGDGRKYRETCKDTEVMLLGGVEWMKLGNINPRWRKGSSISTLEISAGSKFLLSDELAVLARNDSASKPDPAAETSTEALNHDYNRFSSVRDVVAERESLCLLYRMIEKGLKQKELLVSKLEAFTEYPSSTAGDKQCKWLQKCLNQVDVSLAGMFDLLEKLYGPAYRNDSNEAGLFTRDEFSAVFELMSNPSAGEASQVVDAFATATERLNSSMLDGSRKKSDDSDDGLGDAKEKQLRLDINRLLLGSALYGSGIVESEASIAISANNTLTDRPFVFEITGAMDSNLNMLASLSLKEAVSELREASEMLHAEVSLLPLKA